MPRALRDGAGLTIVAAAAFAMLAPALFHGGSLGPYDLLAQMGLSKTPGAVLPPGTFDQIKEMIPWTAVTWTQVHQGHLPLWNPYSALGIPLAFNWQSAAFALPTLVGYAMPLQLAYTAAVLTTLLVAGVGAYVLARVLGCGVIASAFAGTVFELSGAFILWLGWPIASVMSWAGWILAAIVLLFRGSHRFLAWLMLVVTTALAVYAGQADALVPLAAGVAVFASVMVIWRHRSHHCLRATGRSVLELGSAAVTGGLLSAPLLFPGLQLAGLSVRNSSGGVALYGHVPLPAGTFTNFAFLGWNRPSVKGSVETLGVLVVVLAVAGGIKMLRRAAGIGLAALAVFTILFAFVPPIVRWMAGFPGLQAVRPSRAIALLALVVVILAAVGLDSLLRTPSARMLQRVGGGFVLAAVILGVLWRIDIGQHSADSPALRWALVEIVVGFVGVVVLWAAKRTWSASPGHVRWTARAVGGAYIVCAATFLISNDAAWSSSPAGLVATPAEAALKRIVGSSLVGIGVRSREAAYIPQIGILANANVGLGIDEMCVYDPLVPSSYFKSWLRQFGVSGGYTGISTFCPAITTVSQAQLYGVSYVLEPPGHQGPFGTVYVASLDDEPLYRVPGSALATLTAVGHGRPPTDAPGTPVAASRPNPSTVAVTTDSSTAEMLRLRLTEVPGWHASIDGQPLTLIPFRGVMMQARIPPGRHVIRVDYWPNSFRLGLVGAVGGFGVVGGAATVTRRRRRPQNPPRVPHGGMS